MRKLFSILAVALLALSAHATVVTHNLELSSITSQGSATWENPTITANAWEGIQYWFGDYESAFDASEYEVLVLELASASAAGVNYVINYADGTSPNDITIPAGQTSAQLVLKSNKIQKIVIQLTGTGSATLSNLYFKGYAGKVSEEVVVLDEYDNEGALGSGDDAWNNSIQAWSGRFSGLGLQVDDKLVINYTLSGSDDQFRIYACTNDNETYTFTGSDGLVNPEAGTTSIAFPLNSADLEQLTTKGIKIDGKNMTITGVSVLKHAVLWTGSQAIGDWTNTFDIPSSKLSDLQVGNLICVRVSAIGTEAGPRVNLAYGDSWNNFNPIVEYYFQEGDEAPMEVEFPITYKMEQQLRGHKLVIRGVNYTVTDIYVKEGTPVNKVAAYLPVTSAGMATFIVPFNVQDLPAGVQAYELTYDGSSAIMATEVNALEADKPVLIVAAQNEDPGYEFISEEGASDDISGKTGTYANGSLIGTYAEIAALEQTTAGNNNFVLQKHGDDAPAFYQVTDDQCSVPAYRAYLSCSYSPSVSPAPMRIVFHKDATTDIVTVENAEISTQKILRNGQIVIIRDGKTYDIFGRLVD